MPVTNTGLSNKQGNLTDRETETCTDNPSFPGGIGKIVNLPECLIIHTTIPSLRGLKLTGLCMNIPQIRRP